MKEKVYAYLQTIPKGKVTTYGRIATHLGNKHFARAVGNILHDNPDPSRYPCHRVVNSKGRSTMPSAVGQPNENGWKTRGSSLNPTVALILKSTELRGANRNHEFNLVKE